MKRTLSLLLALMLLLPGCGKKQDETTTQPCEVIARVMWVSAPEASEGSDLFRWYLYDGMRHQGFGQEEEYHSDEEMNALLSDFYGLEDLKWFDAAIVRMEGVRAFELAVLSVPEEAQDTVVKAFQEYLLDRQGAFTGYEPEQAALAKDGRVITCGQEVALIVCENAKNVREAFEACYGDGRLAQGVPDFLRPEPEKRPDGRYVYSDPGKDDMTLFDNTAILAAWESGDSSSLSREDKAVLEAAKQVFEECVTPEMSDYHKEYALYTWLTGNVTYDQSHYEKKGAPRTSYEPYGPLVEGKGVCLGFAEAFRLLMDMAGIECITVTGAGFQNRENHAWNMVKLNGEWYCADPTWDLNPGIATRDGETFIQYSYFNVTSQYLADTDHQWDYDNTPEATAEDGGLP
ncbi:DUF4358 domain-containing protein [Colidextribacter sp. OB.20]|uniref:DUF4358 domain-containing protein n=1 Tax=Colidextribacter sp. OB.20 TaxID=2304568 RepID=UPI0013685A75|nr:DUF4358 domain-containing protein [Colidextribacter sp. OB.20]NBI10065.1 DUF4358 domain-containing protein [Colidextribacter sp. OB.20]